jgi:hypothetical protein
LSIRGTCNQPHAKNNNPCMHETTIELK